MRFTYRSLICALISGALCLAQSSKVAGDMAAAQAGQASIQVVVQAKSGSLTQLVSNLLSLGLTVVSQAPLLNMLTVVVTPLQLNTVVNDPNVTYVSPNRPVRYMSDSAASASGAAAAAQQFGVDGHGVTVAVIDSGIDAHADVRGGLLPRILYSESFLPNNLSAADAWGHGTHVAGIIGGAGSASTGPQYRLLSKVLHRA